MHENSPKLRLERRNFLFLSVDLHAARKDIMPDLCVIYNPTAGKMRAERRLETVRQAWGAAAVFRPTAHSGHAADLAQAAADEGFTTVAAAGGDGTVHDVATGLLRSGNKNVRFAVFPIGSANDFSFSLTQMPADLGRIDVGRIRRDDGAQKFFLCNVGLGFSGSVTVEARRLPWLQGSALYGVAALRALASQYECPVLKIQIDDEPVQSTPTLLLAVLLGHREGGFVMAPDARLDDGLLDYVHAGQLSRWNVLTLLPRLALFGPPRAQEKIRTGTCRSLKIESDRPVNVHADGEFLCVKSEGMRSFAIDLLPGALAVDIALSRRGGMPLGT